LALRLDPDPSRRDEAIQQALWIVKNHYALHMDRYLEGLARATAVELADETERALVKEHLMTWAHVRELHRAGMDVQSHTHTHRVMHTLPDRALAQDLMASRRALEEQLEAPVRALAYPVGRANVYPDSMRATVREAGFDLAFSNRGGINWLSRLDRFDTKRITIDPTFDDAHFATVMAVPWLA